MGIFEELAARVAAVEAKLANGTAAPAAVAPVQPAYVPPAAVQPAFDPMTGQPIAPVQPAAVAPAITGYDPATGQPIYAQPAAAAAVAPVAPAQVTEAQVMALIEPHLENVPVKTALQGVLAQMGIARLPDARPDQYAALYAAFSAVIQQFAGAAPAAAAAPVGII